MPAEPPRGRGHLVEEFVAAQRRHRVGALARALERIPARIDLAVDVAGLTRDADLVLDLVVVRLELVETERPVFHRRSLRNARRAVAPLRLNHDLEIPRIQPPA